MITKNTKLTFGKHKGCTLENCPVTYLKWMAKNLKDSDLHEWAIVAEEVSNQLCIEKMRDRSLDAMADEFLRNRGINPRHL